MSGAKRVVAIAIDGSETSEKVFNWYLENIKQPRDFIVLIHVNEISHLTHMPFNDPAAFTAFEKAVREAAQKSEQLIKAYEAKVENAKLPFKTKLESGKPGEAICKVAEEEAAAMIVTGSRGLNVIRRTFVGSVSDYIIHHSKVPVVVCHHA